MFSKNFEMAVVILPVNDDLKLSRNNFKILRGLRSRNRKVRVEGYYCLIK